MLRAWARNFLLLGYLRVRYTPFIMIYLLYDIGLILLSLIAFPKLLFQRLRYKKYRLSFKQRWGLQHINLKGKKKFTIWIHAVSLGETKAIAPIAKMIKERRPDARLIVSSITETGQIEAKRSIPFADEYLYLPFDFSWVVKPVVKLVRPEVVILCESDFWLNFLKSCKDLGSSLILVNGKMSEKSFRRFSRLTPLSKALFGIFDLMCVQNKTYQTRFNAIGVPSKKLVVTGNLKFDQDYPQMDEKEKEELKEKMGIVNGYQLLVLGSTHAPEEAQILQLLQKIWQLFPRLKVLIVPRHPERFKEVADFLAASKIPYALFSTLKSEKKTKERVILMDAMGLLKKCYQIADLAVVGGSFVKHVGGHNILEPCGYGVPVLFGPHTFAQEELVNLVLDYGAGSRVTIDELSRSIVHLLEDAAERCRIGKCGLKLMEDNRGSSKRTWEAIEKYIVSKESSVETRSYSTN